MIDAENLHGSTDPIGWMELVSNGIGVGTDRLPSYMDLFYLWERQQWSVADLDFSTDRQHWDTDTDPLIRKQRLFGYVQFFNGEISVTSALVPFINAMPSLDQRIYITTQLADEAKHSVFFDRWFTDVLGTDREVIGDQLKEYQDYQHPFVKYLLNELLPEISDAIEKNPGDLELLVEGVTLYHLIIEGTLSIASQARILKRCKQAAVFPGFINGMTALARDESRHILFGLRFLQDMVRSSHRHTDRMMGMINKLLPGIIELSVPPKEFLPFMVASGEDPDYLKKFYVNSLKRHIGAIGIDVSITIPQS